MSARQRIPTERREQGGRSPHLRISRRTPLTGPALARLALVVALAAATLLPLAGPAQAGGGSHSTPPAQGPDAVLAWNETATSTALACGLSGNPPGESRLYAMMHIAVHDALNAIKRESLPYTYSPSRLTPGASPTAAVATAARDVLQTGLGACAQFSNVTAAYDAMLATVPDGAAKNSGIRLGATSAATIIGDRAPDNLDQPIMDGGFVQGTAPGQWRFTLQANGVDYNAFAFLPKWGEVKPFVLRNSDQFAPNGPYDLQSRDYAKDLNEIKSLGGDGSSPNTVNKRTPEQTEIALFWVGSSPYQWNSIARTVAAQHRRMDLWDNARLFGLLNMALADGYIGSFETKYTELFWRPETAIRAADTDGNSRTTADPTWLPLQETPPIPDYDSAHAVEGGAAAAVLTAFFGRTSFDNCSPWLPAGNVCAGGSGPGVVRHFTSFTEAANENAVSRIYVGFHFRKAAEDGKRHGHQIGSWAVSTKMRPTSQ
jgi:hypothetical protein